MANYNVAPIGIEIQANIKGAIDAFVRLQGELKKTDKDSKNSTYALQKLSGTMSSMGRILMTSFGFGSLQQGLQTLTRAFTAGYKESSNFIENYNLFNVSFRGNTEQALKFQYELNRAFKTNMSETLRMQGRFENLAFSLGIVSSESDVLSENLTKLTYDISSLFNIDVATASSKLFSGLVGQTKPLRELGIDVTMQTLQTDLDRLGIKAQVTQLTQAEKVLLRYIAILRQSTNAQGDFARTIETPVNQFRIMNAQIQEMTRWFGTLFLGAITKILPYLNAVVIGLKEIFQTFSTLMGFDLNDFDFLGVQEGIDGIGEDSEDATKATEKLKKSLMGFDELNNLSSSSGVDGILGKGSYYDQLAKWIEGYDNGMSKINIKAEEIKENIYSWLGLFKDNHGNIIALDNSFADFVVTVAGFTWDTLKTFFDNFKIFVDDTMKWLKDNPDVADNLIYAFTGVTIALAIVNLAKMATPLGLIVTAVGAFIYFYDDIKKMWEGMTPDQKLITTLLALAVAIGAVSIAMTGGLSAIPIIAGVTAFAASVGVAWNGLTAKKPENNFRSYDEGADNEPAYNPYADDKFIYADGGFPTSGQMFVARENGAEMVGSLGGRTAVANNGQIVEGIKQGVYEAMMSANGSGQPITVVMQYDDIAFGRASISAINKATVSTGQTLLIG